MIRWNGVAFEVPAGMLDQTVLTFVDEARHLSITVAREPLAGGKAALLAYVDEQVREIKKQAPGYTVLAQRERNGAIHVEATITSVGQKRSQHQLYTLVDDGVFVASVTGHDDKRAAAALDVLASSWRSTG